ncbi:Root adhesin [Thalassovita mediterranea]|uniref:Root adhesin n=2 Tax=Thalassovita mediterranea TaxID=340021 RepID=A0A0P1H2A8_9RHOB|nr:Root adhesin [Thalassovita mediterranea]SIS27523.1 Outer membrane protein OmpA [Thalassovita mediterranea]
MMIKAFRTAMACAAVSALGLTALAQSAVAQQQTTTVQGERYIPTIWIDPDGCEHWVMDDGAEGYMTPHLTRKGLPVCRDLNLCGSVNTDQLFATDSYRINSAGRKRLAEFFASASARAFVIVGHTDSRASDAYNMKLSFNRANAVAKVASAAGVQVSDVRGFGERMPIASNSTAAGMQKNRRVEILCFQ